MARKPVVLVATLLLLVASRVYALGLGGIELESSLNQPLNASIEILQLGDVEIDEISIQMASPADFERFNIDRISFLSDIRFTIEAANGAVFVRLTSTQIVREPYLSFILDTRWPSGRILSEHTVLLDLPVFAGDRSSPPVRQPVSPVLQAPPDTQVPTDPVTAPQVSEPVASPQVITPVAPVAEPEEVEQPSAPEPEATDVLAQPEPEPVVEPEPLPQVAPEPEPVSQPPEELEAAVDPVVEPEPVVDPVTEEEEIEEPAPEVAAEDSSDETLVTSEADTLWGIALRVRPNDSVSMQQTMLAIQALNPDAFIGGNINLLRAGQVIRIPNLSDIQSVDQQQAVSEVVRQDRQLQVVDTQPLAAPAPDTTPQRDQQSGQLSVITAEDAETDGAGSALEEENAELDARIAALESQLALREEEVDRVNIERAELTSRLDELEAQIASAMELITLQDAQLAQLQESLATAAAEAAALATTQDSTGQGGGILGSLIRAVTSTTMLMILGAILLVVALVLVLLRRNKPAHVKFEEDLDQIVGEDNRDAGVSPLASAASAAAAAAATGAVRGKSGYSKASLDDELSQILNLSDEYDEYTREDEVVDSDSDETSNGDDRREATRFGAAIDEPTDEPEEVEEGLLEEELNALESVDQDISDDMDFDLDSLDVDEDRAGASTVSAAQDTGAHDKPEDLDFALSDLAEEEPESKSAAPAAVEDDNVFDLTFDLGVDADSAGTDNADTRIEEPGSDNALEFSPAALSLAAESEPEAVPEALESFEFSLDTDTPSPQPEEEKPAVSDELESFEFSLDVPAEETVIEKEEPRKVLASESDDYDDVDFDLDDVEILDDVEESGAGEKSKLDDLGFASAGKAPAADALDDIGDLDFLSADDEVATKLELAYAYQKMGDPEGAREILEEVIKEGNEDQIKEARTLLDSLG